MAKFAFKLQPVFKARQAAEREHQRAVAMLERERLGLEDRLRRQQGQIADSRNALRQDLIGNVDPSTLRVHAGSAMRMMRDAQGLAIDLARIYESLKEARADLAVAATARRAMEVLRDRRYEQWKRVQEKREASMLDDLAGAARAQRRMHQEADL